MPAADQEVRDEKAREARTAFKELDSNAKALENEAKEARAKAKEAKKMAAIAKGEGKVYKLILCSIASFLFCSSSYLCLLFLRCCS